MRTHFRAEQLADRSLAEAEKNLRACVHCGICTATCPTYVLLGDERDGPRGRIVMMQQMLEQGGAPSAETVHHLDRCLSCLGCRTACPSGVDYARLIDQSRAHIEQYYRRPFADRLLRWTIATVLTRPALTRIALKLANVFSPLERLLPGRLGIMAEKAQPLSSPVYGRLRQGFAGQESNDLPAEASAKAGGGVARSAKEGGRGQGGAFFLHSKRTIKFQAERRIALLPGCVQQVIAPDIDAAAIRLLARRGISLEPLPGVGCCGALAHHLGREEEAKVWAKRAIEAFERAGGTGAFEGILITATGCAAHIADYPHLFRDDPEWHTRAQAFESKLVHLTDLVTHTPLEGGSKFANVSEQISGRGHAADGVSDPSPKNASLRSGFFDPPSRGGLNAPLRVALQVPCSLQHGLRGDDGGEALRAAGFEVLAIPEGHLCCGSAGSYSILQPEIAKSLRVRKLENIRAVHPDVIATSNIGCLQHLSGPDAPPIVHIVELLDWAEGGPVPRAMAQRVNSKAGDA